MSILKTFYSHKRFK